VERERRDELVVPVFETDDPDRPGNRQSRPEETERHEFGHRVGDPTESPRPPRSRLPFTVSSISRPSEKISSA